MGVARIVGPVGNRPGQLRPVANRPHNPRYPELAPFEPCRKSRRLVRTRLIYSPTPLGVKEESVLQGKPMSDVTSMLSAITQGDPHAAADLLPLVYDELRRLASQWLAQETPGQTLQ